MPKIAAMLTDTALKALKPAPADKPQGYKKMLGGVPGLHVAVFPSSAKVFKLAYSVNGKETMYTIGRYPELSLADARARALELRKEIAQGTNLTTVRKEAKARALTAALTFKNVSEDWLQLRKAEWSAVHFDDNRQKFIVHVYPAIGDKPISTINKADIRAVLDTLQAQQKAPTLKKVRSIISQVFRFAMDKDIPGVEVDWASQLRGKQYSNPDPKHRAALTTPKDVAKLMQLIQDYRDTSLVTAIAMHFSALTFCRPGEVRHAEWTEIDWDNKLWRIPPEKMKKKTQPHLVPLARQTLELLTELRQLTGHARYLFPSTWGSQKPMSEATVLAALRRMDYSKEQMSAHGFRGMASTLLHEHGFDHTVIERQLAHSERNKVSAAYNHSEYLAERRRMMDWWADYLDNLRNGSGQ